MVKNSKITTPKIFFISKNNIIYDVNQNFAGLIGYTNSELMGKTLEEASSILRLDAQINLGDMQDDTKVFLFTKELVAIEGIISCKTIDNGSKKVFSFTMDYTNLVNERFKLVEKIETNKGDGVAIFTYPGFVLINANKNFLNFFNSAFSIRTNSIGKTLTDIYPEYHLFGFEVVNNHLNKFGTPYYIEEKCVEFSIHEKEYWNISVVPIFNDLKMKFLIVSLSNVTEKVINRKEVEQKKEQLEAVIRSMTDEIVIFDKNLDIIHSNKTAEKSILPDNLSSNNFGDIMKHVVSYDKSNKLISYEDFAFQKVIRGQIVSNYEFKIINKDLGVIHREINGSPIYDKDGNYIGGVLIYKDIQGRINAEESRLIKIQNKTLMKVVEALDLEFVRCTYPDLKIISVNDNSFKNLKETHNGTKSLVSPIGRSYFEVYSVEEENKRRDLHYNFIWKQRTSYIGYTTNTVNGETRYLKTINQPIFGLNNNIAEIIFITMDITDEVKAKNKMEQTIEMQNQMFTTISHELKTPLNVIFSASQLIEMHLKREIDKINKDNISKNIDVIKQNCYRFTKLINNIFDLSRMESGFYILKYNNLNIVEIIEDIIDSVRIYVEEKGLSIIFDTEMEEKIMAVDVDKVERIILNLISNAIKFSNKGDNIYIDIKDKGDFIEILVRDSGIGMNKKDLYMIFGKYHKLDNSLTRNAEGSGMGLALVKTMVDLMDGEIRVESELGKGSLFTVTLPVNTVDEWEVINSNEKLDDRIDRINIEFSDIYHK